MKLTAIVLACIALLAVTVWVAKLGLNYMFALVPMVFMFIITLTALVLFVYSNLMGSNYTLSVISILLFILAVVLAFQAFKVIEFKQKRTVAIK